ncbi:MAG TPA: sensor histidine kinase [Pyrinomonadaceae bacterium]|nr:sensor histidine kinase [Pyrinomonadaceae bacterium]
MFTLTAQFLPVVILFVIVGIRGKLLLLAAGIAVPLVVVGALDLRNMWRLSRAQLDDSVKQQVDLASVALERWLDAQKRALDAIAALAGENDTSTPTVRQNLETVLRTRPFWLDLRITNSAGTTIMSQPTRREVLPTALTDYLVSQMREQASWTVVTDRTVDEAQPIVIIAVPIEKGGAVIARIDGAAINQLFDNIKLSQQAIISVLDSDGRVLYRRRGSEAPSEVDVSWSPLSSVLSTEQTSVAELTSPIDGVKRVYGVAHVRGTSLLAMIGIPSALLYEPARQRMIRYSIIAAIALFLALGAALVIERSIVRPVRRLRSTAQRLGSGDLAARAPRLGGGEIGDLGVAFNTMANQIAEREERLTELDRLKSEFVSSVSHELKTPLTTIKLLAHLLQHSELPEEERLEHARTIAIECDRQIDFVGNLLDLSRIESGAYKLRKTRVDVRELVNSSVAAERPRADSLGIGLTTVFDPKLPPVKGDFEALRRVIRGLIDNAIKYTPEGGYINVSAKPATDNVVIAVNDSGKGISEADVSHVFEKFYRGSQEFGETSRGTAAPGVGLGLYLAQHIVTQLHGEISVESELGRGTTFKVLLPVWEDVAERKEESADAEALVGS